MTNRIGSLNAVLQVLIDQETYKDSPYMHGLTNGLILAKALLEDNEAKFKELPKEYFEDKEKFRLKKEMFK